MQYGHQAAFRRAALILTLTLVLAALAVAQAASPIGKQPGVQVEIASPTSATPLVPVAVQALDPFPRPLTQTMTDTVQLMLDEYNRFSVEGFVRPLVVPNSDALVFLPILRRAAPEPTPTPEPSAPPADVSVTLWPDPSIRAARGDRIAYTLRVTNYGDGTADSTQVTLPYSRQQMVAVGSLFDQEGDWVSELTDSYLQVSFGPLDPDEQRTATLFFRVQQAPPDNAVISMRASYNWDDGRSGGGWRSNWAPVLVGSFNNSAPWVWVHVEPVSGPVGTIHRFYTDRFIPEEGVYIWLNTPSGVGPLNAVVEADAYGRVTFDYTSAGLAPGTYQLVFYGARSQLTGIETFFVE